MLDALAQYIEAGVEVARVWGPLLIFIFMTIESSFVPFPSEIIMIPAGVMIARHEFVGGDATGLGLTIAVAAGLAGSIAGALLNYFLARWLGRPFLHRYGRYFFVKPEALDRAEALFRKHGEITTFVCRLLPAIRQLISIPAGLSRMSLARFSLFTSLGAGIWVAILAATGYAVGQASVGKDYRTLVYEGKDLLHQHFLWIVLGLAALVGVYIMIQRWVMKPEQAAPGT
ncbi:MAG: DedA family protein [Pseudomonadota bacterium]